MNEIVKLYKEHPVRIVDRGGEPWFVAKDVCAVLEIAKVDSAIRSLDEDEKDTHSMSTLGGDQEMSIVSEAGLYSLVLRSRKPEAKTFKRWVTHEVLPSIRKTGAYVAPNLSMEQISAVARKLGAMANQLITENAGLREKIEYLEQFIPKGEFGEPSSVNGKPKWRQRRGCYVSVNGRKPKRLNPDTNGYLQLDLFRDFIPAMLVADAVNIINFHCPKLLEEKSYV